MVFRIVAVGILSLLSIVGCKHNSNVKSNSQDEPKRLVEIEVFSLYRKVDSKFHVARAMSNGGDKFDLYLYELETSVPEGTKQSFVSVQQLTREELDNRKADLQSDYTWQPFKGDDVLFVQIDPAGFSNEFELLEKRQEIEVKLGNALEGAGLGDWIAGDIGPGGANMLFKVKDIVKSMDLCLNVLRQEQLDGKVRIARRVRIESDDWFYEVIHPAKYSGDFNSV